MFVNEVVERGVYNSRCCIAQPTIISIHSLCQARDESVGRMNNTVKVYEPAHACQPCMYMCK